MYIRNNTGSITVPWRTPDSTGRSKEDSPFTRTLEVFYPAMGFSCNSVIFAFVILRQVPSIWLSETPGNTIVAFRSPFLFIHFWHHLSNLPHLRVSGRYSCVVRKIVLDKLCGTENSFQKCNIWERSVHNSSRQLRVVYPSRITHLKESQTLLYKDFPF